MTREEILQHGVPVEPNSFETDREEQWYKVGLYEGATASPWHKVDREEDMPLSYVDCLFHLEDGAIFKGYMLDCGCVYFYEVAPMAIDIREIKHWMEIPKLPE